MQEDETWEAGGHDFSVCSLCIPLNLQPHQYHDSLHYQDLMLGAVAQKQGTGTHIARLPFINEPLATTSEF